MHKTRLTKEVKMKQRIKTLRNGKRIVLMKMDKVCRRSLTFAMWAWKQDIEQRYMRPNPFTFAQFDITNELNKFDYL